MNITIRADHGVEMTEAIKNYAEKKISEVINKFGKNVSMDIELGKTTGHHHHGNMYKASVKVSGDLNFMTQEVKDDLYAAIDGLKSKLEYELASAKDKNKTIFKKVAYNIKNFLRRE